MGGWELVIELIVIDMPKFDMIIDMDFLNGYEIQIDYRKKKLVSIWTMVKSSLLERVKFSTWWLTVLDTIYNDPSCILGTYSQ